MDEQTRIASLQAAGYDPDKYDLDDLGQVSERVSNVQPSIVSKPAAPTPSAGNQSSAFGTLGRSAAASAVPTGTGFLGGALAAEYLPLAHVAPPWSELGAGLIGALGGGYLGSKAQAAVMPEGIKQQLATDESQHPTASAIGGFIPAMAAFNPVSGLRNLPNVGRSAIKMLGADAGTLTAGAKNDLINTLINTGTSAGQNIYEQNQDATKPFDYSNLALNAGLSSILNTPSKVGRAIGFNSGSDIDRVNSMRAAEEQQALLARQTSGTPEVSPSIAPASTPFLQPDVTSELVNPRYAPRTAKEGVLGMLKSPADLASDPRELARMQEEGGGVNPEPNTGKEHEYSLMEAEKARQDLESERLRNLELQRKNSEAEAEQLRQHSSNLEESLKAKQIQGWERRREPFVKDAAGNETTIPTKDYTGGVEQINTETKAESPADLALRKLEGNVGDKYSSESELDARKPHPYDKLTWEQLPKGFKDKVHALAVKRGISLEQARSIIDPKTGQEKLGKANYENRTATVSETLGRGDTGTHEVAHNFLDDLKNSAIPADQMLHKRALDITGGDAVAADENLASKMGVAGYNKITGNPDRVSSWYKDFINRWKNVLGVNVSEKEVVDYLTHRMLTDAPRGMRGEIKDTSLGAYNALVSKHKEETNPEKKIEIQKQMESIKNLPENKGMPPKFQDESFLDTKNLTTKPEPTFASKLRDAENERIQKHLEDKVKDFEFMSSGDKKEYTDRYDKLKENKGQAVSEEFNHEPFGSRYEKPGNPKFQGESGLTPDTVNLGFRAKEDTSKDRELTKLPYSTAPVFRPLLDSIRRTQGESGGKLADASQKYYVDKDAIVGSHMYPINKSGAELNLEDQYKVDKVLTAERRAGKSFRDDSGLNDKQLALYDAIRNEYARKQQEQIEAKQPVTDFDSNTGKPELRQAKIDPFYHINQTDPKVLETLRNYPNSESAKLRKQEFLDYQKQMGISPEAAQKKLDAILLSNSPSATLRLKEGGAANYFKADRIAQGVGLPDSWMKKDLLTRKLNRYYNRVATDRAFHDNIESSPDVAKSIGLTTDPWGEKIESTASPIGGQDVNTLLESMRGEAHSEDASKVKAFNRVATSLMLGPVTNTHIVISSLANANNYLHPGEALAGWTHALTKFNSSYEEALKTGYAKKDPYRVSDIFDNTNTFSDRLGALAQTINNISGRKLVNQTTKGLLQGVGDYVVGQRLIEGKNGSSEAVSLLKRLDPEYSSEKEYSAEAKAQLASTLAGLIHGAHDARTMPRWMLHDSAIQPFFSLASWNIAQTNNFMRHVYSPALRGDFTPLIMSTLGAALGGYALKEVREAITDKKAPFPWLADLKASSKVVEGNIPLVAYNLMSMASMSGYAGILSMLGKTGFDIAYKNIPQGAAFPLDEIMTGSINTARHAIGAISNATSIEEVTPIIMKSVADLARENIQLARIAHTWGVELAKDSSGKPLFPEQKYAKDMSKAKQSYRNFRMAEGQPVTEQAPDESNPYLDLPIKSFKKTEDLGEAAQMIPGLIQRAITRAKSNPEILKTELQKIKTNNYQTMPNPENIPMEFFKYINYLNETQGKDKASEKMIDYMKRNAINKFKGSMVPSL